MRNGYLIIEGHEARMIKAVPVGEMQDGRRFYLVYHEADENGNEISETDLMLYYKRVGGKRYSVFMEL